MNTNLLIHRHAHRPNPDEDLHNRLSQLLLHTAEDLAKAAYSLRADPSALTVANLSQIPA